MRTPLLSTLMLPRDMLVRRMKPRGSEGGGRSSERRLAIAILAVGGISGALMAFLTGH